MNHHENTIQQFEENSVGRYFSFKPLNTLMMPTDSMDEPPLSVFRDNNETDAASISKLPVPFVVCRNDSLIKEQQQSCWDLPIQAVHHREEKTKPPARRRIISPYPYSHSSQEKVDECEQLLTDGSLSSYLMHGNDGLSVILMDCDDFSISSREMYSLSKDDYMCLHSISDDHTKFWEESMGLQSTRITEECSGIPIEIDLSSSSSVCSSMSDLTI